MVPRRGLRNTFGDTTIRWLIIGSLYQCLDRIVITFCFVGFALVSHGLYLRNVPLFGVPTDTIYTGKTCQAFPAPETAIKPAVAAVRNSSGLRSIYLFISGTLVAYTDFPDRDCTEYPVIRHNEICLLLAGYPDNGRPDTHYHRDVEYIYADAHTCYPVFSNQKLSGSLPEFKYLFICLQSGTWKLNIKRIH